MTKPDKKQMKSAARLYAVQALFQMESSWQTVESVVREFETHRFGAVYDGDEMAEGDVTHFRAVIGHAVNFQARIDQMTDRALVAKWPIDRIDPVLRALFRAAGAVVVGKPTPTQAAIYENNDERGDKRIRRGGKGVLPRGQGRKMVKGSKGQSGARGASRGVLKPADRGR